jgi:hypothetical protein
MVVTHQRPISRHSVLTYRRCFSGWEPPPRSVISYRHGGGAPLQSPMAGGRHLVPKSSSFFREDRLPLGPVRRVGFGSPFTTNPMRPDECWPIEGRVFPIPGRAMTIGAVLLGARGSLGRASNPEPKRDSQDPDGRRHQARALHTLLVRPRQHTSQVIRPCVFLRHICPPR